MGREWRSVETVLGPESKPSLGLVMMYTAMAKAKKAATDIDLRELECNMLNLL